MIEQIRKRLAAATPGPWGWFGNTDTHHIYLATRQPGRRFVMLFRRWGMQDAKPQFQGARVERPGIVDADELVRYEVEPTAVDRNDPRVYRADITGIRHPDAELIARAPEDIGYLLDRLEQIAEVIREAGRYEITDHDAVERATAVLVKEGLR